MMETPCANMIERDPPECAVGRRIPDDCHRACAYYQPGLTDQERVRAVAWAAIMGHLKESLHEAVSEP